MKIIGLIGGSGCGKSTVAQVFARHGVRHIDGDRVARTVQKKGSPCLAELADAFGTNILRDGELDRKALAERAFSSPEKTALLNQITHRYILAEFDRIIDEEKTDALIDAAALVESGYIGKCDTVITVEAPVLIRLKRIRERDGLTRKEAMKRLKAQKPKRFFRQYADHIIKNNGTIKELERKAEELYSIIFTDQEGSING